MENYFIEKDIPVIYVKATSFPGGVGEAHQNYMAMFPRPVEVNIMAYLTPIREIQLYIWLL
ncbi:MAG: hypothetical protein HC905_09795 [Bacteroidales bacterium]|nr:hypothetical protein [Bacteroidales bacterium]